MIVEMLGIISSIIILLSMSVKSVSVQGNILMRYINILGSILMCLYGFILSAYSTIFLNSCVIIIHIYYIMKLKKEIKNNEN